mgnify:FL=1
MTNQFHRALNRMAFFTALLAAGLILFYAPFLRVASANVVLNGIIIGTTLFGIGLCFVEMFKLLPEYKWARAYFAGRKNAPLPPRLLRPVALMLRARPLRIQASTLNGMLDMIQMRFDDSRESVRYITNTLIFLGLLGTFWGLIITVGGFADLIGNLNFADENVLTAMQSGLTRPLSGMATAFTSSLMGLAGSLTVGFLGLQVQLAQNGIFRDVEDYLAAHTSVAPIDDTSVVCNATKELNKSVQELKQTFSELA